MASTVVPTRSFTAGMTSKPTWAIIAAMGISEYFTKDKKKTVETHLKISMYRGTPLFNRRTSNNPMGNQSSALSGPSATRPTQTTQPTTSEVIDVKKEVNLLPFILVENEESLAEFMNVLEMCAVENQGSLFDDPELFMDAEGGNRHGRHYSLNTLQLHFKSRSENWLLDIPPLGYKLFDTPSEPGRNRTFRQILHDAKIAKCFFDVRADSDSLFGHYQVHLKGVADIQLIEIATRDTIKRTWRWGLDRCIEDLPDNVLRKSERDLWSNIKKAGKAICQANGGYKVFDQRPMLQELQQYAINDVVCMPLLYYSLYLDRDLVFMSDLRDRVLRGSEEAVTDSIRDDYVGNTEWSARSPENVRVLDDQWNGCSMH